MNQLGNPLTMVKETLTFELDRELYNSWCSIGTALNLATNSQIAHYLILCFLRQDGSETNKCGTCGWMLTLHCARCTNEKSSQNVEWSEKSGELSPEQTIRLTGQAERTTSGTMPLPTKSDDAVQSDAICVQNEVANSQAADQNVFRDLTLPCHVEMAPPWKSEDISPSMESLPVFFADRPAELINPDFNCKQTKHKLVKLVSLLANPEPTSSLPGTNQETGLSPGTFKLMQVQTAQKLQKLKSILKTPVEDNLYLSNISGQTDSRKLEKKCSKPQHKKTALKTVPLPKICTSLPTAALPAANSTSDKDNLSNIVILFPNKSVQPQAQQLTPVKMVSLLTKSISVSGPVPDAVNTFNVKKEIIDLDAMRSVKEMSDQNMMQGSVPVKGKAFLPSTKTDAETKDIGTIPELSIAGKKHKKKMKRVPHCNICNKTFTTLGTLRVHKDSIHKGLKPFQCDVCGQTYATRTSLKSHQMIHSDTKPHQCSLCSKSFKTRRQLKLHSTVHSGLKGNVCEVCGKRFGDGSNLRRHTRAVHSGVKNFVCNTCGKAFSRSEYLKKHNILAHMPKSMRHSMRPGHLNVKREICETCGKSFASYYISIHRTTHTGEKQYKCKDCGKGFRQRHYLKQHTLMHLGLKPYKCKLCSKTFTFSSSLSEHEKMHGSPKYYECEVCGNKIKYYSNMRRHMKQHHKVEGNFMGRMIKIEYE